MTSILDDDPTPIDRPCGFVPAQTVGEWWRGMSVHGQGIAAANAVGGFAGYTWEREIRDFARAFKGLVGDPPVIMSDGLAATIGAAGGFPPTEPATAAETMATMRTAVASLGNPFSMQRPSRE